MIRFINNIHQIYWRGAIGLLLFIGISINANTQDDAIDFEVLKGANGISLGKINAIAQDKTGYIWLSDQSNKCIIRYDGTHMKQYRNNPKDLNSLGGNYPECLFVDPSGVLWIGFGGGGGLDKFDMASETFTHFRHDSTALGSLSHNNVWAIHVDRLGDLWVGTHDGLNRLNKATGKFDHFRNIENDSTSLSNNVVRAIYEDSEGVLWIGTGLFWEPNNDFGGLNRYDRETETFKQYKNIPGNPNSLINNKVRAIFEDSRGNFWIGTAGDGLHSLNRKTNKITRHTFDPNHPKKLSRPALNNFMDHITFINEDSDSNLWIGTWVKGITRYNLNTEKIAHYGEGWDNSESFPEVSTWAAHTTSDGLVWVSTEFSNTYKIDIRNRKISHIDLSADVNSFFEDSQSNLWMATENGILIKDEENNTIQHILNDPNDDNSISHNNVRKILEDRDGGLWISTQEGLNFYNRLEGKFTRYLHDPNDNSTISDNDVWDLYEDDDSNIWICTQEGGLNVYDKKLKIYKNYNKELTEVTGMAQNQLMTIVKGDESDLWFGTFDNGIIRMDRMTGEFYHFFPNKQRANLYYDSAGELWAAMDDGLYHFNRTIDDFELFTFEDDIVCLDEIVMSIIEDNDKNLWMSTLNGIFKLNSTRNRLSHFGAKNNVTFRDWDRFSTGFSYRSKEGRIFIRNSGGYYSFFPESLKQDEYEAPLLFSSLWINNELTDPSLLSSLRIQGSEPHKIDLAHNQNLFSFACSKIDFRQTEESPIYYTLENYDVEWHQTSSGEKVNYYRLPPGDYTLRVKAANNLNGSWTENELMLSIAPPWWKTDLAYIFYGLFILIGGRLIYQFQKSHVIRLERERSQIKELEQAKEIEKAYTKLKSTQTQLIHAEKMASLGELTAGIAHEIQNPLNFVNNFSDVSAELLDEMSDEISKGDMEEVHSISENLKKNLKKISHHGQRASSIVKGMLDHSRTGSNEKVLTDINVLCDEYLRLAYHGLKAKDKTFNATYATKFDESIPQMKIVVQEIVRVLLNLLNNAFYAVDSKSKSFQNSNNEGEYKPLVSMSTVLIDSNTAQIIVEDNGIGISKEVVDKIFQPFFTTKPTGSGTGLGLSLAYDIIKAHGGSITVESQAGKGSTFVIRLPIQV